VSEYQSSLSMLYVSMMRSLVLIVSILGVFVCVCLAQPTGRGGGKCEENNGTVYACPTYNYTRYPGDYELRVYDLDTWAIESVNASIISNPTAQPIEGLESVYLPLNAYFTGANSEGLKISRAVAPVAVATVAVSPGVWGYLGVFFLPPLSSYPPPTPTNASIQVIGGKASGNLQAYVRQYSLDRVPGDDEINMEGERFAERLAMDQRKFLNLTIAGFYNIITAKGNWTKEIWYFAEPSLFTTALPGNWVNARASTPASKKSASRRKHLAHETGV